MSDDGGRDAFGNPIARQPSHGGFAPPVAPAAPGGSTPLETGPPPVKTERPAQSENRIATGHPTGGPGHEWTRSPGPSEMADGATIALALGIGSLMFPPVAPLAWFYGRRVLRRIEASHGRLGGRGITAIGTVIGALMTVVIALAVIGFIARGGH